MSRDPYLSLAGTLLLDLITTLLSDKVTQPVRMSPETDPSLKFFLPLTPTQ